MCICSCMVQGVNDLLSIIKNRREIFSDAKKRVIKRYATTVIVLHFSQRLRWKLIGNMRMGVWPYPLSMDHYVYYNSFSEVFIEWTYIFIFSRYHGRSHFSCALCHNFIVIGDIIYELIIVWWRCGLQKTTNKSLFVLF